MNQTGSQGSEEEGLWFARNPESIQELVTKGHGDRSRNQTSPSGRLPTQQEESLFRNVFLSMVLPSLGKQ